MPTEIEKIEKTTDVSDEILTVGGLVGHLQKFDPDALIRMSDTNYGLDNSGGIHLDIHKIIETSEPSCEEGRATKTVYLEVED